MYYSQPMGLGTMVNNQVTGMPYAPHKRGGSAKKSPCVLAHFNKGELVTLSQLQGGERRDPKTNLPEINLDSLFSDHHAMDHIKNHIMQHRATGGKVSPALKNLAAQGIHGDNALALVSEPTHRALTYLGGGSSINPHTGLPQHFSLSSILSGASSLLSSVPGLLSKIPIVGDVIGAGSNLLSKVPIVGNILGGLLGGGGGEASAAPTPSTGSGKSPSMLDMIKGLGEQVLQQHGSSLPAWAQGAARAGMDMMGGKNPMDAMKGYGQNLMDQYGSQMPAWMRGAGNTALNMMNGQSPRQALSQYGSSMMDQYGQDLPMWAQAAGKTAANIGKGADPREEMMHYGQGMMNQYGGQLPNYMKRGLTMGLNSFGGQEAHDDNEYAM